jgi:DNA-directed RNA polymerase subunit H (RpoH/RPB5)
MVVKSATKKRLMELGVDEEYAHKLATDRNMADIKQLSIDEVATVVSLSKDDDKFSSLMDVIREVGATRRKRRSKKITINAKAVDEDDFPLGLTKFNVLNHEMVPHQELIEEEEEEEALAPWGLIVDDEETGEPRLAKELLPKIHITDPVIQVIKETKEKEDMLLTAADPEHVPLPAGWLADRVIRVNRQSLSAGVSVAYRLIVEGN